MHGKGTRADREGPSRQENQNTVVHLRSIWLNRENKKIKMYLTPAPDLYDLSDIQYNFMRFRVSDDNAIFSL